MKPSSRSLFLLLGLCAVLPGCLNLRAVNTKLDEVAPEKGYRRFSEQKGWEPGRVWLTLAFSGGGTRAAAFAYGVMEELRDTEFMVGGKSVRLVDEVDTISAVSGGTFPAAYYGLFGDRIFDDFEAKFLNRNVQRDLILQAFRPWNMIRLFSPSFSRSLLALDFYDEHVFDGATFADLSAADGPHIHINATDLSHGYRFTFSQGQFDFICSDLDKLPVAAAVAASSAVPVLLSPITLRNYAGTCDFAAPDWIEESLGQGRADRRRYEAALSFSDFMDADTRPYIHLVDGGIADNLGLRFSIDLVSAAGGAQNLLDRTGIVPPEQFIVIVVNAETDPNPKIDLSSKAPSFAALMGSVSGSQIRRYNLETLLLAEESVKQFSQLFSEATGNPSEAHLIEVSFDSIDQEDRKRYFKRIPTSFSLKGETVNDLRQAGRDLLRMNPLFQGLLKSIGGRSLACSTAESRTEAADASAHHERPGCPEGVAETSAR
ncbi:MAG: patatin-like phospholipase family protein [Myxococcota bacterium]|nr:patatin-like phospholipase family protein [Myxococcota bacterium]